jgi:hypothetical protein
LQSACRKEKEEKETEKEEEEKEKEKEEKECVKTISSQETCGDNPLASNSLSLTFVR